MNNIFSHCVQHISYHIILYHIIYSSLLAGYPWGPGVTTIGPWHTLACRKSRLNGATCSPWVVLVEKGWGWGLRMLDLMQPRDRHSTLAPYSSRQQFKYGLTWSIGLPRRADDIFMSYDCCSCNYSFIDIPSYCRNQIHRPFHVDIFISSGGLGSIRYSISES